MPFYHQYKAHKFRRSSRVLIDQASEIISEMASQGYTLTLRQLYYQFVRRNWIENKEAMYKRLGRLVSDAREAGEMDWFAIEDRGRNAYSTPTEEDPSRVLMGIENGLVFDQWARQDHYLEVWVEKQALEAVISRPCNERDVTYMACKGYLSTSESWRAGQRFRDAIERGKKPVLIHLADHDPSGLNMTDDNDHRLRIFSESFEPDEIEVRRIALNMDQVEQYKPPPNPAKQKDSRYAHYKRLYGPDSWELDALEPRVLHKLILDTIDEYRDEKLWDEVLSMQEEARLPLEALGDNWDEVRDFMQEQGLF